MMAAALSALLLLGVSSAEGAANPGMNLPHVGTDLGELYPPIVLPSLDGKRTLALPQFAGKKLLLVQFASW